MSANNQTLIKEYKNKWYVFTNVNAESWSDRKNILSIKGANGVFDEMDEAYHFALDLDKKQGQFEEGTEYGVQFDRLCKDDAEVFLKD